MSRKMTKEEIKAGRAALKKARAELERVGKRDAAEHKAKGGRWGGAPESTAFHRANDAVIRAEKNVPWWAR